MAPDCRIRPFAPEDLPALQDIREAAYRPVFASFRRIVGEAIAPAAFAGAEQEQAEYLEKICSPDSDREVYVAERNSKIVGFFSLALNGASKIGEIDLNAVAPDHQGAGIGTVMYAFALDRMKKAGMTVATVGTGGDQSHAPARRAYEKVGFGPAVPSLHLYKAL